VYGLVPEVKKNIFLNFQEIFVFSIDGVLYNVGKQIKLFLFFLQEASRALS
jgi:hypothetical protein